MRLFLDFEFTGLHQYTMPISIGIVSEDGREFYGEFTDFNTLMLTDWLKDNIIPNTLYLSLPEDKRETITKPANHYIADTETIVRKLLIWLRQFPSVEIWADCLAYDWVLFCQLFGGALNLPRNIYYIPFDICTYFKVRGIDPDVDREEFAKTGVITRDNTCSVLGKHIGMHNSLVDARVLRDCFEVLQEK